MFPARLDENKIEFCKTNHVNFQMRHPVVLLKRNIGV